MSGVLGFGYVDNKRFVTSSFMMNSVRIRRDAVNETTREDIKKKMSGFVRRNLLIPTK